MFIYCSALIFTGSCLSILIDGHIKDIKLVRKTTHTRLVQATIAVDDPMTYPCQHCPEIHLEESNLPRVVRNTLIDYKNAMIGD